MVKVLDFLYVHVFKTSLKWLAAKLLKFAMWTLLKVIEPEQVAQMFSKIFLFYTEDIQEVDKQEDQLAKIFEGIALTLRQLHNTEYNQEEKEEFDIIERLKEIEGNKRK
jgi:hypothetical protein